MPDQPELMAIGDSLAQGCRSMSVRKEFCEQSVSARMAYLNDWKFLSPDHPRPVLFDLEREIRDLLQNIVGLFPVISGLGGRLRANGYEWYRDIESTLPLSTSPYFDNLGITGAEIEHSFDKTAGDWLSDIHRIMDDGVLDLPLQEMFGHYNDLLDLHMAINGYFVLNPTNDKANLNKTPLDWVAERKPRRLLVQTGHNHGLFDIGALAKGDLVTYKSLERIDEFITQLAQLPSEIESILVFNFPKVSAVANLGLNGKIQPNGYAEEYEPVFYPSSGVWTAQEMAKHDESIEETNDDLVQHYDEIFKAHGGDSNAARLKHVDFHGIFERYDAKHKGRRASVVKIDVPGTDLRIDNHYIDGRKKRKTGRNRHRPPFTYRLEKGGLQSIDGMHPTGVGYAMIACEVLKAIGFDVSKRDEKALLKRAYLDDRLLSNLPWATFNTVLKVMDIIRNQGGSNSDIPTDRGLPGKEDASPDQLVAFGAYLFRRRR